MVREGVPDGADRMTPEQLQQLLEFWRLILGQFEIGALSATEWVFTRAASDQLAANGRTR